MKAPFVRKGEVVENEVRREREVQLKGSKKKWKEKINLRESI